MYLRRVKEEIADAQVVTFSDSGCPHQREEDIARRMYHWNRLRVKERKHISHCGLVFTNQRRVSTSSIQAEAIAPVTSVGYAINVQQVLTDVTGKKFLI